MMFRQVGRTGFRNGADCIFRIDIFPKREAEDCSEMMVTDPPTSPPTGPAVTQKVNLPTTDGMTRHAVRKNEYKTLIVPERKEHSFGDIDIDGRIILKASCLFDDALSRSDYIVSNYGMISEQ
jgi:hypothetical protein